MRCGLPHLPRQHVFLEQCPSLSFVAIEKADEIKAVKLNYPAPLDYGLVCRKDEADPLALSFCQVMQEQAEGM